MLGLMMIRETSNFIRYTVCNPLCVARQHAYIQLRHMRLLTTKESQRIANICEYVWADVIDCTKSLVNWQMHTSQGSSSLT